MFVSIWRIKFKGSYGAWGKAPRGPMDSSFFSNSFSFSFILSKSLFILLIFFLLNLALVFSDALVILSFKESIRDFKLSISFSKFLNFLFSLESLFFLCLSCLFVNGASSNSGLSGL